jgi:acetoin utilization deacetylase AcuC-like enzyme
VEVLMNIPVYFRSDMSVKNNDSFSPSAGKPALAVADWLARELPIEVRSFEPVTRRDLQSVHRRAYVDGVFAGTWDNGFGNADPAVAEACRYTCGSMLAAALAAAARPLDGPRRDWIVCSPSSGFHHAHYGSGGGFCTFNGLALAAAALARRGLRAAILDLDQHYGDGTADIISHLRLDVPVYSWRSRRPTAREFLAALPSLVIELVDGCDVLLYQAGADPHDDPLGGYMTTEELRRRDDLVFGTCIKERVPVAWNLAGGYQRDVDGSIAPTLAVHRNTMEAAVDVMRQLEGSALLESAEAGVPRWLRRSPAGSRREPRAR